MKILKIVFLALVLSVVSFAQTNNYLQFKGRIGFEDEKERIMARQFSPDGTRLTLIGLKSIQTWDVASARLIESHPHEIVSLDNFFKTSYVMSPDGSKVVTLDSVGRDGDKKEDRVNGYVYDVKTGKRIAVLERPDMSVRFAFWSENGETLVTFSGLYSQKRTEISFWNGADLSFRRSIMVDGYTWHLLSRDGRRMFVGNGGQIKFLGLPAGPSNGNAIRVYDTRTAEVVKELNAGGAEFDIDFVATHVSSDERFIATSKEKNIVVWDTSGDSKPVYELAPRKPKGKIHLKGFSADGKYLFARQDDVDEFYDAATGRPAEDVPTLVKLQREDKFLVPNPYAPIVGNVYVTMQLGGGYYEENPVLLAPGAKHAVVRECDKASVVDLGAAQTLYTIKGRCVGGGGSLAEPYRDTYNYSEDVFRFSPTGRLLINFRYDRLVVRDLQTGQVLQTILRKQDRNLMDVPKWTIEWDVKGRSALTVGEDRKSMLVWEINEG